MALQAKLQAKYWREVEHQAQTAVEKRKAEADKRKFKAMSKAQKMKMLTDIHPFELNSVPKSMQQELNKIYISKKQKMNAKIIENWRKNCFEAFKSPIFSN